MRDLLTPLLFFQRFIIPAMLIGLLWAIWRMLAKKDLAVGLGLYVSLLVLVDGFYNTGLYIPGLEKGSIRYSEICALILLFQRPPAPQTSSGTRRMVLFLVGCYFFLLFVAALRADPLMAGVFDFRRIIFPQILALALAVRGLRSYEDYRRFLLCVAAMTLIISTFCFWDVFFDRWILHSDMLFKPEYYINRKHGRFGSVLLNPNFLGAFVVLLFPPLFMLALNESNRRLRIYLGVALLGLLFCLVQTQSRGPLLAFVGAIVLLVMGPAGKISRKRRFAGLVTAMLAFAMFMPGFIERATSRFDEIDKESSMEEVSRSSVWEYTMRIIGKHPMLGVGLGEKQFLAAMDQTDFRARYGRASLDNPHNSYLQAAAYAGIPALLLFILANVVLLSKATGAAYRRANEAQEASATFGLAVGVAGFMISMYPDMHLFTQHVAPLYWLFFGLLLAFVSAPPQHAAAQATLPKAASLRRPPPLVYPARRKPVPPNSTTNSTLEGSPH